MRCAWLVTAVAACTSVPAEPTYEAPALVEVGTESGTIQVHGPGYDVTFAPDGMVRMPETITVDGESNLLENQACPSESLMGVAVFPALVAAATEHAVASTIVRLADGPVIAKLAVTYDVASNCDGVARHLTGTTRLTFFPTGRINREDAMVSPTETAIPGGAACQECGGAGTPPVSVFFFETYYNLSEATYVTATGSTPPGDPAPAQACGVVRGRSIGIAWRTDNPGVGPRLQNGAYVHDWVRRESGSLQPQVRAAFSDLVLPDRAGETCAEVLEVAREVPLRIAGSEAPPGRDGIYRAPGGRQDTFEIELANPGVDGAITHGFAVSFDLGTPDHLAVKRSGSGATRRYRLQPDPDEPARVIVWFEDGIAPGETITLEAS